MARILLISIDYYAYPDEIVKALGQMGHEVTHHPIEKRTFGAKTLKRLTPAYYRKRLDEYHAQIVEASADTAFDIVLFIQVHHVSMANIMRLKALHPAARFVLYNWDSLAVHDYSRYLAFFDRVFTFDENDAARLGVSYLPLFALPEYFNVTSERPPRFDVYFVGSMGTIARVEALKKFDAFCGQNGLRFSKRLHCSPYALFLLVKHGLFMDGVTTRSIPTAQIAALAAQSTAVFDYANHPQSGFTMRLIENLAAGRKIITSNHLVREQPFYSPDRILIFAGTDFSAVPDFLATPLAAQRSFDEFTVRNWATQVLAP